MNDPLMRLEEITRCQPWLNGHGSAEDCWNAAIRIARDALKAPHATTALFRLKALEKVLEGWENYKYATTIGTAIQLAGCEKGLSDSLDALAALSTSGSTPDKEGA